MQSTKILIVEDDIDIRESLTDFLTWEEFKVASAGNGKEALDFLESNDPPSLIFLDQMMPVMDGPELLAKLEEKYPQFKVPVVIVSANAYTGQSPLVVDYMKKPLDLDNIVSMITRYTLLPAVSMMTPQRILPVSLGTC